MAAVVVAAEVAAAALAVIQAVVVAVRAAAVARVAVVPAAAAVTAVARGVVAAAGAAVVVAATAVDKVVATKTVTVNLGIAPVIAARGIRAAAATIVVIAWIKTAREIAYSFVTQMSRGTMIATVIVTAIAIVIVAAIEIVIATEIEIATEIGIASTKAPAFTIRRIMAGTVTAPMLMSRATGTACSPAQTMAAEGRTMTLSVLTSTGVGLLADSSHCSLMGLTGKLIEMALSAAIRRAIKTGRRTLWAGAFAVSCLHRQIAKVYPAAG